MRTDELVPLAVAVIVLTLSMIWIGASGGYNQSVWYPSALGMIALWVIMVAWGHRLLPPQPAARLALLAFAGLVAFNYLSIAWATVQGDALDFANQLALYLLSAWVLALLPWTPGRLAAFAGLWSVGVCAFCVVTVLRTVTASSLTIFYVNGRFATPMQYSNATGALGVMGMWPALILSSRRELPWWLRGCLAAVATFLGTFAVLPESRAALLGMALTAPLALVVMSDRIRLLGRMLLVGGAVALCLPQVLRIDDAINVGHRVGPTLHHLAFLMALASAAALVIGLALAALEDRLPVRTRAKPATALTRKSKAAAATTALLLVIVAAVVLEPHVAHLVNTAANQGKTDAGTGSNRLLSTSPEERFDYARVALHLFSGAPVGGIGSGNFGYWYDALRHFAKHSMYTHNLPLRVLCETGVLGTILYIVMLAALVVGMIRLARSRVDSTRACVGIAFTVSGYFLVHSCLDWVDAFPALAVPAIGLPLACLTVRAPSAAVAPAAVVSLGPESRRHQVINRLGWAIGATAGIAMFAALTSAYLSLQYTNRAFVIFRNNPQGAYHDLRIAGSLSPLSADPITSTGTIALYANDLGRSEQAFSKSAAWENTWYPRLELAVLYAHAGQFAAAGVQVDAAARLDVEDPLIAEARSMIRRHRRIDPIAFDQRLAAEGNSSAVVQKSIQ